MDREYLFLKISNILRLRKGNTPKDQKLHAMTWILDLSPNQHWPGFRMILTSRLLSFDYFNNWTASCPKYPLLPLLRSKPFFPTSKCFKSASKELFLNSISIMIPLYYVQLYIVYIILNQLYHIHFCLLL